MSFLGIKTKKEKITETEEIKIQENSKTQKELGYKLYGMLQGAAGENKIYNLDDSNNKRQGIGPIDVGRIENNGPWYTIHIYIRNNESQHYFVAQINIDAQKNIIHILLGNYGPEQEFTLEKFGYVAESLVKYLKEYCNYGKRREHTTYLRQTLFGVKE